MKPALVPVKEPPPRRPSIGRMVHYTTRTPDGALVVHMAFITAVGEGNLVSLVVFPPPYYASELPAPTYAELSVSLSDVPAGTPGAARKWSWPAYGPASPDPPQAKE